VVVVVGGMGSLAGAFLASLLIGVVQTFAVALDYSLATALRELGVACHEQTFGYRCCRSPSRRSRPSCRTCSWC
jgi:branched-chain amino acid transport system permease protein